MILVRLLVVAFLGCAPATVFAQATPAPASSTSLPPDVVTTSDGGMYRGTIVAKIPGKYVDIQLANGETERIDMATVEYAGPQEGLTRKAEPEVRNEPAPHAERELRPRTTVVGKEVPLRLKSTGAPVTFHQRSGTASGYSSRGTRVESVGYDEMCTTPCEIVTAEGTYTFALGSPGNPPVEAPPVTVQTRHQRLVATYEDNSDARLAGAIFFYGGLLGGLAVTLAMVGSDADTSTTIGAGVGIMLGGTVLGLVISRPDEARVDVSKHAPPSNRPAPGVRMSGTF